VSNEYAPEHLILHVRDARRWLERVTGGRVGVPRAVESRAAGRLLLRHQPRAADLWLRVERYSGLVGGRFPASDHRTGIDPCAGSPGLGPTASTLGRPRRTRRTRPRRRRAPATPADDRSSPPTARWHRRSVDARHVRRSAPCSAYEHAAMGSTLRASARQRVALAARRCGRPAMRVLSLNRYPEPQPAGAGVRPRPALRGRRRTRC
jgi:hypothetical protein